MRPIVLYRESEMPKEELASAQKEFPCIKSRMDVQSGDLVIARYSALPFYKELEEDIRHSGGEMINTLFDHAYIADLRNWVEDLREMTPETWYRLQDISDDGPFILKGKTNSKKHNWSTHMYAENKREAGNVYSRLCEDGLIGYQDVYIRRYEPLVTYITSLNGLPITQEYRFFVGYGRILCGGYYWDAYSPDIEEQTGIKVPGPECVPSEFLHEAINRLSGKAPFFALDVGRKVTGEWVVIEINDGQMAGLSACPSRDLYRNLRSVIDTIHV